MISCYNEHGFRYAVSLTLNGEETDIDSLMASIPRDIVERYTPLQNYVLWDKYKTEPWYAIYRYLYIQSENHAINEEGYSFGRPFDIDETKYRIMIHGTVKGEKEAITFFIDKIEPVIHKLLTFTRFSRIELFHPVLPNRAADVVAARKQKEEQEGKEHAKRDARKGAGYCTCKYCRQWREVEAYRIECNREKEKQESIQYQQELNRGYHDEMIRVYGPHVFDYSPENDYGRRRGLGFHDRYPEVCATQCKHK